jgi:hypothetical protein
MKKTIFGLTIFIVLEVLSIYLIFGVIKPDLMKSKVPNMIHYLQDNGYKNPKYDGLNSLTNTVYFKTSDKEVSVRFSNGGLFQIVY